MGPMQFGLQFVLTGLPMPGRTALQGVAEFQLEDDKWRMEVACDAPTVDPWPNTEFGGHEVNGTMALYREDVLVRSWPSCQMNVWRNEADEPRRMYMENNLTPEHPEDWELGEHGGNPPREDNVIFDNDTETWLWSCTFAASADVVPG